MAATNDVTGDRLQTKAVSDKYRDGYDAIFKKGAEKSASSLIQSMNFLRLHMLDVAREMQYYGGFSEIGKHSHELIAAACILNTWIEGLENDHVEPGGSSSVPQNQPKQVG
jgi:hypothetical protein